MPMPVAPAEDCLELLFEGGEAAKKPLPLSPRPKEEVEELLAEFAATAICWIPRGPSRGGSGMLRRGS